LDGAGESIPLDDGVADGVTFAQAWHWVDPVRGAAEVARVLRPGGVFGLVWNVRDETKPWSARLGALMKQPESRVMDYGAPVVLSLRTMRWIERGSPCSRLSTFEPYH
ncbi:methyltransferase domain-containing protein, partial [Bacillus sp. S34]|nr:methyltransferase domain-containing protein [Bacillus sp. S34]